MAGILDYPFGYRGLTLNQHRKVDGTYDKTYELDTYLVEQFDFAGLQVRDQREGLHLDTGGILGPATRVFRRISLRGSIRATAAETLEDMDAALNHAFDIEEAQREEPADRGVFPFDFYTPTNAPPDGHTAPIHELFFARPVGFPQTFERRSVGQTMAFALELACPDPRRYTYDVTDILFDATEGWSQLLHNWPDGVGFETYPVVQVNMIGTGEAGFTITDGTKSLVLDLSNTDQDFYIDMQKRQILRSSDGALRNHIRTSDVDSFFGLPAGGATWSFSNLTNMQEALVSYRMARS